MITIIKHGHPRYKMTCRYCECQFTFEDIDIHSNDAPNDYIEWIDCPDCGRFNQILERSEYKYIETGNEKHLTSG